MKATRHIPLDPAVEASLHAYNAAFEELCLPWHWDAATFMRLQAMGSDGLRHYLETEQPHLLRAYEADFLVRAIEAAKARCCESMASHPASTAAWAPGGRGGSDRIAA